MGIDLRDVAVSCPADMANPMFPWQAVQVMFPDILVQLATSFSAQICARFVAMLQNRSLDTLDS